MYCGGGYASLNKQVFSWLRKPVIVCCVFHSVGEAIEKPQLPMASLGQTEERYSRFPGVRLLVLIKDHKYVGWENLMALKVIRLYLNNMQYVIGSQGSFFGRKGVTWLFLSTLKTILQRAF